jgi:hypothetical protein
MTADVERTALKEWAVLIDAMARGEIIAMVRKGGIREHRAGFLVRHERFLLYPTWFHENPQHLAARFRPMLERSYAGRGSTGMIRIEHIAEVCAVWNITDPSLLPAVAHEHGLAPEAVEARFHYRGTPTVRLVAVRTLGLATPVEIPEARRYAGCVSWLELDADIVVGGAHPAVDERSLQKRLGVLHALLGEPERERQ